MVVATVLCLDDCCCGGSERSRSFMASSLDDQVTSQAIRDCFCDVCNQQSSAIDMGSFLDGLLVTPPQLLPPDAIQQLPATPGADVNRSRSVSPDHPRLRFAFFFINGFLRRDHFYRPRLDPEGPFDPRPLQDTRISYVRSTVFVGNAKTLSFHPWFMRTFY